MASLASMNSIVDKFSPAFQLMQDAKSDDNQKVTSQNAAISRPSSTIDPEIVKQTLNTFNDYAQVTEIQTDAISSQTKAIDGQTDLLLEQGEILEDMYGAQMALIKATKSHTKAISNMVTTLDDHGEILSEIYEAQELHTDTVEFQTDAIKSQTDILKGHGATLEEIGFTMDRMYDLAYDEANKINPKIQNTAMSDSFREWQRRMDDQKYNQKQIMLLQQILQAIVMQGGSSDFSLPDIGGPDEKGKKGKKGIWSSIKGGAGRAFSYVGGLGRAAVDGIKSGGGGLRGKLGKAALGVGAAAVGYKGLESLGHLGAVSAMEESGSKGVGAISSGKGDHGGVSYGTHQLSSSSGTMSKFLRSEHGQKYAADFAGLTPGTAAFNAAYKSVVARDREGFADAQAGFMKQTHYDPLARKVADDTGLDVSQKSRAMQELVFSTATQYGGSTGVISKALKGKDIQSMSDAELISTIQDYKRDNVGTHFKSSDAATQRSVQKRTIREKATLLKVLEDEQLNAQKAETEKKGVSAPEALAATQAGQNPVGVAPVPSGDITQNPVVSQSQNHVGIFPIKQEPSISELPTVGSGMSATDGAGVALAGAGVAKTGVDVMGAAKGIGEASAKRAALKALPVVGNVAIAGIDVADIVTNAKMTKEEKQRGLVGVGGGMAGGAALGAATGAAMGSVIPGPGTLIGGVIGGGIGYALGQSGAESAMDAVLGTPQERAGKNDGIYPSPNGITLPTVTELMTVNNAAPKTEVMDVQPATTKTNVETVQPAKELVQQATQTSTQINPASPASPEFYKAEPTISQKPQTSTQGQSTQTAAATAPAASAIPAQTVKQTVAPEPVQRNQFDTVQNVRMAVDQPAAPAAPAAAPSAGGQKTGSTGNKPTLDDVPALINDFGLIFVNSGFL